MCTPVEVGLTYYTSDLVSVPMKLNNSIGEQFEGVEDLD